MNIWLSSFTDNNNLYQENPDSEHRQVDINNERSNSNICHKKPEEQLERILTII